MVNIKGECTGDQFRQTAASDMSIRRKPAQPAAAAYSRLSIIRTGSTTMFCLSYPVGKKRVFDEVSDCEHRDVSKWCYALMLDCGMIYSVMFFRIRGLLASSTD